MEELQKQQQGAEPQASETSAQQGKTYDEDYVKSLRAEAAKYRTKAKELEASSKQAQQELMGKVFAALGIEPDPNKEFDKLLTEAQTKAQEAEARANARILQAEAKAQAAALGVKAERLPYLLKLADLSNVEFGEDGEPNGEQIKAALSAVISDFPELVSQPTPPRAGVPFNHPPQPNDLQSKLEKAIRDGDTTTAIRLKRMMTFLK
jgi:hypothetical protein